MYSVVRSRYPRRVAVTVASGAVTRSVKTEILETTVDYDSYRSGILPAATGLSSLLRCGT